MSDKGSIPHINVLIVWLTVSWLLNLSYPRIWVPVWVSILLSLLLTFYLVYRILKGDINSLWIAYTLTVVTSVICIYLVAYDLFWNTGEYPFWWLTLEGSLAFGILLPLYFISLLEVTMSFAYEVALIIVLNAALYLAIRWMLRKTEELRAE